MQTVDARKQHKMLGKVVLSQEHADSSYMDAISAQGVERWLSHFIYPSNKRLLIDLRKEIGE